MKTPKVGDKITDYITTRFVKSLTRQEVGKTDRNVGAYKEDVTPITCQVIGNSNTILNMYDPVNIVQPALDGEVYSDNYDSATQSCQCIVDTNLVEGRWGILLAPTDQTRGSKAILAGVTWARFRLNAETDTHVRIKDGLLQSDTSGPAIILKKPRGNTLPRTEVGFIFINRASSSDIGFFELLEDMPAGHGSKAWAKFVDWAGATIEEGYIYNWGRTVPAIIGGYQSGTFGTYNQILSRRAFQQAECGQLCTTAVTLPLGNPPNATIGQTNYTYTLGSTGGSVTANSWSATGLPSGWSINSSTGAITGPSSSPGVVGPARTIYVYVSATAAKTGGGTCALRRRIAINIVV